MTPPTKVERVAPLVFLQLTYIFNTEGQTISESSALLRSHEVLLAVTAIEIGYYP